MSRVAEHAPKLCRIIWVVSLSSSVFCKHSLRLGCQHRKITAASSTGESAGDWKIQLERAAFPSRQSASVP